MKKLVYLLLGVGCLAEMKQDRFETTLKEMQVAEENQDNLYIAVIDGNERITLYDPVTLEKEYSFYNYDSLALLFLGFCICLLLVVLFAAISY